MVTDWNDPDIGKGKGQIHVYDPKTKKVTLAGALTVFGNKGGGDELVKIEEGLLGIELDPDFAHNGWVYLHYTPHSQINRDTQHGRAPGLPLHPGPRRPNKLDLASEKVLLKLAGADPQLLPRGRRHGLGLQGQPLHRDRRQQLLAVQRRLLGQQPGSRTTRASPSPTPAAPPATPTTSTARSCASTPRHDGTYTLPEGNLFTGKETDEGGGKTRGEIYVMGVRNPARISVDKKTDTLYAGWVGPDAGAPSTTWGPAKYDTFAVITKAGNQGWPYCMGNKQPYRDRNLPDPTKPLGWYDCDHPKNESPNNDGLVNLPPVTGQQHLVLARRAAAPTTRATPNGIPSYKLAEQKLPAAVAQGRRPGHDERPGLPLRRDERQRRTSGPPYWDGKWFVGDFYDADQPRHAVVTDPKTAGSGGLPCTPSRLKKIIPVGDDGIRNLMDWKFGPDGSLYVLDYGRGFFTSDAKSALWRVTYKGGEPTPPPSDLARKAAQ